MVLAIFKRMFYNKKERIYERVVRVNNSENTEYPKYMTNRQYREELNKMLEGIDDNYELRWLYIFIRERTRSSN